MPSFLASKLNVLLTKDWRCLKKLWSLPLNKINLKDLCERVDSETDEFVEEEGDEEEDCENKKMVMI